ncbi:MAG: hypothetical protein Alpg2KO_01900 [Alphaproteobacteria bacterium]
MANDDTTKQPAETKRLSPLSAVLLIPKVLVIAGATYGAISLFSFPYSAFSHEGVRSEWDQFVDSRDNAGHASARLGDIFSGSDFDEACFAHMRVDEAELFPTKKIGFWAGLELYLIKEASGSDSSSLHFFADGALRKSVHFGSFSTLRWANANGACLSADAIVTLNTTMPANR